MVKKQKEQRTERREDICGGIGRAHVRYLFEEREMKYDAEREEAMNKKFGIID